MAAAQAMAAHRRGDKDEEGEPTIEATVGMLIEAQTARATIEIAAVLKGAFGHGR